MYLSSVVNSMIACVCRHECIVRSLELAIIADPSDVSHLLHVSLLHSFKATGE